MKKCIAFGLMLMVAAAMAHGQVDSVAQGKPSKHRLFVLPKLEVYGGALALAYGPIRLLGGYPRKLYPVWLPITVEVGVGKRMSVIAGLSGRYKGINYTDPNGSGYYIRERLQGVKLSLAARIYWSGGDGQGFYLQPTAKLVWQSYSIRNSEVSASGANSDFIFGSRFGYQQRLTKGLYLDAAVGPALGIRNELGHDYYGFLYYFNVGMGEIDNPSLRLIEYAGPRWTTVYLVADASLALGWRF